MTDLYGHNIDINYENFVTQCPYSDCKNVNIFNRASDLETFKPISSKEVECFTCKRKFYIKSDDVSEKHVYLIYDCAELLKQKRYMYCVINLCIACEAFFFNGIEVKLLWEPWKEKVYGRNTDILNCNLNTLYEKTKDYSYSKLLNVFFDLYLNDKSFRSQTAIAEYLKVIDCFAKIEPKDEDIKKYHDQKTRDLFLHLKNLKINELRNKVVHKHAFRPSLQDVEKHLTNIRCVVFDLQAKLKIKHQITYYN